MELRLPYNWTPRQYQEPLWKYLAAGGKRAVCRWHRRSGKDEVFLHHTACAAHERVGNYWYMLPEYSQARKSMWDAVNPHSGKRRIDEVFPTQIRSFTRENEMMIGFRNGSTFQLVGSDNFDSLVGSPPVGLVFSEYALSNPSAWGYLRPILLENGGWVGFNSTPRGNNHFKNLCKHAESSPDWFYQVLTAEQTLVFTQEQLDEELRELQALHGDDYGRALWLQEYFVSFDAAIPGSIWGDCIEKAQREGRLGKVVFEAGFPVSTAWDLGRTDATAIWFFQFILGEIRICDYHESNFKDIPFYAELLKDKSKEHGFVYGTHWFPHDARPRTLAAGGKSILQQFIDLKVGRCVIAKRLDKQEQIQAARATFPRCRFDAEKCEKGIEGLRNYRREWDEASKSFSDHPVHDWCLIGETEVLTRYGTHQIMNLPETGEVLTSCGWKEYRNPRITRRNAPLVEVRFTGGYTVKCTPDHPFLTDNGWKFAADLTTGSRILSSLTPLRSISMAVFIVFGLGKDISHAAVRNCIEKFGALRSCQFPMRVISIIKTAIQTIIFYRILNVCRRLNILVQVPRKKLMESETASRMEQSLKTRGLPKKQDKRPLNGTVQRLEDYGTEGKPKVPKAGQNGNSKPGTVYSAARNLLGRFGKAMNGNFAPIRARPLIIENVETLNETYDVWCLTVPSIEEFSLSNGAIVHNSSHGSDAFSILSLTWKFPKNKNPDSPLIEKLQSESVGDISFGALKKKHLSRMREQRELSN